MRKILRYNDAIQNALGCKVKPEPWMHIGIKTPSKRLPFVGYAIWVWDTRKVLEQLVKQDFGNAGTAKLIAQCDTAMKQGQMADDNHKPLQGAEDIWYEDPKLRHVTMSLDIVMEMNVQASGTPKTGLWQYLCNLANVDPARTKTLYYCMVNDFNMYVGGRPGEYGYTGKTEVVPLGHYVKITSDMDDAKIKQLMQASKSGTAGFASRMQARYHGNPSCGRKGQFRELVSTTEFRSKWLDTAL